MFSFEPTSIAVIGASAQPGKVGHDILRNLTTQGYQGRVVAVNPKGGTILGVPAFPEIGDVPGDIEMAIIVTPASTVLELAEACAKKGVRSLVVISAGFGELGTPEGHEREAQLRDVVARTGMTMLGANCLGFLRPRAGLNASFAGNLPPRGHIALLSQSGALAVALMDAAPRLQLGFSVVASLGNKTSHDECDLLRVAADDPETHVIGLYLESLPRASAFGRLAASITPHKPIVLLKSGTSRRGQRAASSHTGALAGSDAAVTALCKQAGIHRASTSAEFTDLLRVLGGTGTLASRRMGIITNAGGPGILATDAAERAGLQLSTLTPSTITALRAALPPAASPLNPVDVLGDAAADRYTAALQLLAIDPEVDGLTVILTPQVMTPVSDVARAIVAHAKRHPMLPLTVCFMGGDGVEAGRDILRTANIPSFDTPEAAITAMGQLGTGPIAPLEAATPSPLAREAQAILTSSSGLLNEDDTSRLLQLYQLPLPAARVAQTADEAVAAAEAIGLPVVAKISSPDLVHKSDVGGVRINLRTADAVREAFSSILADVQAKAPQARRQGVLLQQFLPAGNEFIVGGVQDPVFGPLIMVGLGGIYAELFRDTAFRLAPITTATAYTMLQELRAWRLLLGMRGQPQSDIDALATLVAQVSQLLVDCPNIEELDLNPVLVSTRGVTVADAKIVLRQAER
jgi:acetyltransferase